MIAALVRAPGDVRDRLRRAPVDPLPEDRREQTRLDVRMPSELRERFDKWVGHSDLGQIIRAAILDTEAGDAEKPSEVPAHETLARTKSRGSPEEGARTLTPPRKPLRTAPQRRGITWKERNQTPAARPPKAAAPGSPSADVLDLIAARVRQRRREQWCLGRPILTVRVERADPEDSDRLVETLIDDPGCFLLAATWDGEVEVALAARIADGAAGDELRILIGLRNGNDEPDLLGLDAPGAVANEVVALARRLGRDGNYQAIVHWLTRADAAVLGVVELVADLR